jgi:xanthine permease XanP
MTHRDGTMSRRPEDLVYSVDERPPASVAVPFTLQFVVQHVALSLMIPIIIVAAVGGPSEMTAALLSSLLIAEGVGTVLQALRGRGIGCGYLMPNACDESFLVATLHAAQAGGLALAFGMTAVAGLLQMGLSRVVRELRVLFPPEVMGMVITVLGFSLIPFGIQSFLGMTDGIGTSGFVPAGVGVAVLTLAVLVVSPRFGEKYEANAIITALAVGLGASYLLGLYPADALEQVMAAPLLQAPDIASFGWSFDLRLLPIFLIAVIATTIQTITNVTIGQRVNDAAWVRPDMENIRDGVFTIGLTNVFAGVIGSPGVSTASSELGISVASRITSRYIGFLFGGALIVCAFVPMATTAFSLVPIYVIGAVVVYICAFLIMVGITTMLSRMMDTRKVLVIGLSLVFGLSVQFVPYVFEDVPPIFEPVFASSITLATITAIVLNLVLRIGIRQEESLVLEPGAAAAREIEVFLRRKGEEWGAREEVIVRASAAATEVAEGTMGSLTDGPVEVSASFDELNLDLAVRYTGQALDFPASRPTEEEMLEDDRGFAAFAWYMAGQYADRAWSREENGRCRAFLHFDH